MPSEHNNKDTESLVHFPTENTTENDSVDEDPLMNVCEVADCCVE